MISLHGNHIPDANYGDPEESTKCSSISTNDQEMEFTDVASLGFQENGVVSDANAPLELGGSVISLTSSTKTGSKNVETLQTDVLKLSSHLAQVQFRVEQLRFHTDKNTVLDKQLTELSSFIDSNLSSRVEARDNSSSGDGPTDKVEHHQALIADLKDQLNALEASAEQKSILTGKLSDGSTRSQEQSKLVSFTRSVFGKLKTQSSLTSPYTNYQSVPTTEPSEVSLMTKDTEPNDLFADLVEPEEINKIPSELKTLKEKEIEAILKSLPVDPIAIGRIIIHGILDTKLIAPMSAWPRLLDIDPKLLPISSQSTYGDSLTHSAKSMLGIVKSPIQTGACMKNMFTAGSNSQPELTDRQVMSKAWLALCHLFSEIGGADLISNPRYTTLLAFNYQVKFPEEIAFARELYKVIKKHQTTNHDISQMFATFCLWMTMKRKKKEWCCLVFERLGAKGYYEKWAGHVLKSDEVAEALACYDVERDFRS